MSSEKVLGIDLGTTNTVFSLLEGGEPIIIENEEGDTTTSSVVAFSNEKKKLVGQPAVNQSIQNPNRTISSIKRKMGRENYEEEIGTETFTPEEISAYILEKVKSDAEDFYGQHIDRAVITVPAYFNDRQRQATKNAGEIAGFTVERIINEPTAAALAYGLDRNQDQTAIVADLGGGTFDVSVLELGDGVCDVIATNGRRYLGGDDWDKTLVDYFIDRFEEDTNIDLRDDPQAYQRVMNDAEKVKKDLTTRHDANIDLPFIATTDEGPVHLQDNITREKFEQITSIHRQKLTKPINDAINEANISKRDIDNILLVGGSTRMPQIVREIEGLIGRQAQSNINPEEAVAMGAAIQGGIISGEKDDIVLLDVAPMSLGIEIKGGLFEPLISKNTTIPTRTTKLYTTSQDNQVTVDIKVYQGEKKIAEENDLLDRFTLEGIPRADAGTPEIVVEFRIDSNGIVHVNAKERKTGKQEGITIEGGTGLSDVEIDTLKEKSKEIEEASKSEKEKIAARSRADNIVSHARTILLDESTPLDPTAAIEIENAISEVDEALESDDATTGDIRRKTENLEQKIGKSNSDKQELPS